LLDVDVLIPAAISNQITKDNAKNVKAKLILEMANAPVTKDADSILFDRDIDVIPDILANSGGVIVSYYEWKQNQTSTCWSEKEVNRLLKETMIKAFNVVCEHRKDSKYDLRTAAYGYAIKRILEAEYKRGTLKK